MRYRKSVCGPQGEVPSHAQQTRISIFCRNASTALSVRSFCIHPLTTQNPEGHVMSSAHLLRQSMTDDELLDVLAALDLKELAARGEGDPCQGLRAVEQHVVSRGATALGFWPSVGQQTEACNLGRSDIRA